MCYIIITLIIIVYNIKICFAILQDDYLLHTRAVYMKPLSWILRYFSKRVK